MASLAGVVFDVDGTLVDSERDGHRVAFNRAFEEACLPDRWDPATYGRLLAVTGGRRRLDAYFAEQGMGEDERAALAARLHGRKTELFLDLMAEGAVPARPGTTELLDALDAAGVPLAVATTGSRRWVVPLLDRHFGAGRFSVIVTGDDVTRRKPDPEAYQVVLDRMQVPAAQLVAVEDSDNGVRSALAAGLPVVAVTNDYTAGQDLSGAALVVGSFDRLDVDALRSAAGADGGPAVTPPPPGAAAP